MTTTRIYKSADEALEAANKDQHAGWPETLKPDYDAFNADLLDKTQIDTNPSPSPSPSQFMTEPIYVGLGAEITEQPQPWRKSQCQGTAARPRTNPETKS